MAQIVNDPNTVVSARRAGINAAVAARTGVALDWAIGGVPFLGFSNDQYAYRRQLTDVRREQIDMQPQAGESSLDGFVWRRSQTSWHYGAGLSYSDPQPQSDSEQYQYLSSKGIDPWTLGEIKLLPAVTQIRSSVAANPMLVGVTNGVWIAEGNKLYWYDDGGLGTTITASGTILSVTTDGARVWWATATGLFAMEADGTGTRTLVTYASATHVLVRWVKFRLILCVGPIVYELPTGEETGAVSSTNKVYTHPSSSWVWTGMADALTSIIGTGYAGTNGGLIRFSLSSVNDGTLARLTSGVSGAVLPRGEIPLSISAYLGTVMGIGTNKGVRIASIDPYYQTLTYGPLLYQGQGEVVESTASSRFLWVSAKFDGTPGLIRVDLSRLNKDGFHSWATDIYADVGSGTVTSVARYGDGDRLMFAVSGQGTYVQHATDLVSSGTVTMAAARFSTAVPKVFRSVQVDTDTQFGNIWVGAGADGVTPVNLVNISETGPSSNTVVLDRHLTGTVGEATLTFTLNRGLTTTAGPSLLAYTVKAWPTPERGTIWSIPLLCMNNERDRNGAQWHPSVYGRLSELEDMAKSGTVVLLQRFGTAGESWAAEAIVEQIQFVRSVAPQYSNHDGEDGGYLIAILRSV